MHSLLASDTNPNRDVGPEATARRMSGPAIGIPFVLADIGFTGLYLTSSVAHPGELVSGLLWMACLGLPLAPLLAVLCGGAATVLALRARDRRQTMWSLTVTTFGMLGTAGVWLLWKSAAR